MAIRPVSHKVTQSFGVRNSAYRLGYHPGTDFGSPTGTPIKATTSGTVRYYPGSNGGYGNVAALILKNGDVVWHAHLQKAGKTGAVAKGATIGYTNNTGWSTGAHLHVEYRVGGSQNRPIDFIKWLAAHPEYPLTVTTIQAANVRTKPSTSAKIVKVLPKGSKFVSVGIVGGTRVSGNNRWHKTKAGHYIWSGNTNRK